MSDSQDAKNARSLQRRMQSMVDAGYQVDADTLYRLANSNPAGFGDMAGVAPGTALTPQQVQEVIGRIATPGTHVGGDGMTLDKYMADPRSAIKMEGGQYVYRPEQAQGDFQSVDQESFWESFGPFALVAGAMGGLPMAASMGLFGGAAGAAGGAEAAGLGALNSFDTGAMASILGTDVAGAGAAGGLGALNSFDTGAMADILGTNVAGGAATAGAGTVASTAANGASALSRVLAGTATADDWLKIGGTVGSGLLGAYSANKQGDALKDESARLDAIQAPWRGRLSDMYANPNGFLDSAPVRASIDQGSQAVARALSTQYGNPALAPNAVAEISKYANNSLYDKWGAEANRLAAFGGMNFPATASSGLNVQGAEADNGVYDALGYTLGQLTAPKQMTVADLLKQMNSGGSIFGAQTVRV